MLIFEPISPWSYAAFAAAILAGLLLLVRGVVDYGRGRTPWRMLGGGKGTRIAVLCLSLMAAVLLALAALNPLWTDKPGKTAGFHLQVAVDVSESVLRARGGWEGVQKQAYEKINSSVASLPGKLRGKCTAGILTFRGNTNEARDKRPLKDLPEAFAKVDNSMFAGGEGSNIEAGLNKAASLMEKAGGQGAVLLISDGNQTTGDALTVAQHLARQGVPIHVYPVTSRGPAVAITDANLPRQIHTDVKTFVRGLMLNRLQADKEADLALAKIPGNINDDNPSVEKMVSNKRVSLPAGQWVRFRWPVIFDEFGLQFIDLSLAPVGGKERQQHRRRFFTYAKRPPKILAIGGDNRWMSAISRDVAEIIPVEPTEPIDRDRLKKVDAVVISSVPAQQLPMQSMIAVVQAVEDDGVGLMFINGGHEGADAESETVIMSYKETPLERLLPVKGGPRPFMDEPPSRQVAILIDTSGSMGGWRIEKTKEIARHIVLNLLRPQDRLDLITFTTGAGHLLEDRYMDESGKEEALHAIASVRAGGGTDPRRALDLIGSRKMVECGLIFISDGEFSLVGFRPDCRTTAFEIGGNHFSRSKAMKELADPIPVGPGFDPKAIIVPYFQPEERLKFFEEGRFKPMSMAGYLPGNQRLPVPGLYLQGNAVCHLKEGAILNGVRPKLTDPVLAYGEGGAGYVGVFTSAIPDRWLKLKEGQKAIAAWLGRLIPFMDRDRYNFKLEEHGDAISLRISLAAKSGELPRVDRLTATIHLPGQVFKGIALRADESIPGTFHGEIRVDRKNKTQRAFLSLRESGPDALPRAQRIPILIPPGGKVNSSPTAEAYSYGQNRELLMKIAEVGGGTFDPPKGTPFFKEKTTADRGHPLWPLLAVIAVFCYLTAIALKRWNP